MITSVTLDGYVPGELPAKFEAGTPPIAEVIGLAAAVDYLQRFDLSDVLHHERELARATIEMLHSMEGVTVLGPDMEHRAGIVSFVIDGLSCQDLAIFLDRQGVAIRAGHHCAMPLHDYLGQPGSCRASYYLYNTVDDVAQFGEALERVIEKLR